MIITSRRLLMLFPIHLTSLSFHFIQVISEPDITFLIRSLFDFFFKSSFLDGLVSCGPIAVNIYYTGILRFKEGTWRLKLSKCT